MKGAQGAGAAKGMGQSDRFFQALGKQNMGKGSSKIGMQYANAGLQAPPVPNMMNAVNSMQQQQQQGPMRQTTQINPLLAMLMGGGR